MQVIYRSFLAFLFFNACLGGLAQNRKFDSLRGLLQKELPDTVRIKTLINFGRNFLYLAHYDSCYKYVSRAHDLSVKKDFKKGLAHSSNTLGQYFTHTGQNDSAFYFYDKALINYGIIKDSAMLAGVFNNIGNAYKNQGNIPKALDNYFKSLRLKERMNDPMGVANACTNIGNLYSNFNDTVNTLKYLLKGLHLREQVGDTADLANSYTALGLYYRKTGNLIRATRYLRVAMEMLKTVGDAEGYAIACYNLGNVLNQQGNFKECEVMYRRALDYSIQNNDKEGIASCYEVLGEMKMKAGDTDGAVVYLEKAIEAAKASNIAELQSNVNKLLADAYEKKGDHKKALHFYKQWTTLKDSLFSLENIQKLTSSELKYEHEKEKLLLAAEQDKKEVLAKEKDFKKNIIVLCSIIFLILMSVFAVVLFRRLNVNRMQKSLIEEQNREIRDSIKYAKRIQNALMTNKEVIGKQFSDSFIYFKPKDIVSGDFFWAGSLPVDLGMPGADKKQFLAVCDSTGHGVPGAFMSLLNIGFLNEAVAEKKIQEPNEVFNYVKKRLIESISQEDQKDGMDGVLLCIDKANNLITYSGANNGPVVVRNQEILEMPYDRIPVGKGEKTDTFQSYSLPAKKGDIVYLYTDGFADQFGGLRGKKFMYKRLNEFLLQISEKSLSEQATLLDKKFEEWRGSLEQVDDVCVVGLKI